MFTGFDDFNYLIVYVNDFYDFLYENDYPIWFCNKAKELNHDERAVREFIMQLLTGESISDVGFNLSDDIDDLIQQILENLASNILNLHYSPNSSYSYDLDDIDVLTRNLELDGYEYKDGKLLTSESDVLDTKEEAGILETLYGSLELNNKETAMHHLQLSEEDYKDNKWDNSISNSRKFLECVLSEVANKYSMYDRRIPLGRKKCERNSAILEYLEESDLLGVKERKAFSAVYHLLSDTGSHPNIAADDQARLLRHLSLTLSHFIMLRLQGRFQSQ